MENAELKAEIYDLLVNIDKLSAKLREKQAELNSKEKEKK